MKWVVVGLWALALGACADELPSEVVFECATAGAACDDGSVCTTKDVCVGGSCKGSGQKTCDDGNPCTNDTCDVKKGCMYVANTAGCDDGSVCTTKDVCVGGSCKGSGQKTCDDGNPCTNDTCDDSWGCQHANNTASCSDNNACTTSDVCVGGSCLAGVKKSCAQTTWPCHVSACNASSGACSIKLAANGSSCGGGNKGKCSAGACVWVDTAGRTWGLVPSGTFQMGCNATLDKSCSSDEKPQHLVTITSSYWLGLYEVTVDEYGACVTAGQCSAPGAGASYFSSSCKAGSETANWSDVGRGSHPLNCVTWSRASAYCQWVGGRLATEAEWEMAARGRCDENGGALGCASKMRVYPWGNGAPVCGKQAVYSSGGWGCGQGTTWAVGTGSAQGRGPYGHYDLAGNVWEWVEDWYDGSFYSKAGATSSNPKNTSSSSGRVFRGGSFDSSTSDLRAGNRGSFPASYAYDGVGLRCVRSYP